MCQIPTIGPKTAKQLVQTFGEEMMEQMLADNVYDFINLMDENGNLVFADRRALRMERSMANLEFGFGQGGYQPTEYIKRYLPDGYFDLMIVDLW
jgi:5'-3' exonuclease